jgi:hypothetical protein
MYNTKRRAVYLILFFSLNSTCMEFNFFTNRNKIVKNLLENETCIDTKLDEIGHQFEEENKTVCTWFEMHKSTILPFIKKASNDAEIKIMGSRRWQTSHLLSDIDAVVVTNSENPETLLDALQNYYGTKYPDVKPLRTKTKAGLFLFILKDFADPILGKMKIEYTIQNSETNKAIIDGMTSRLTAKFNNNREKTEYAFAMMKAVYNKDEKKQLNLKEWTRILSQ